MDKAQKIEELQESNNLLKSQVAVLQTDHGELKELVRKQGIMVMEHEEILGSGKIEKLFQRVDVLEAKMSETEEAISHGFQEASDDRMQIRDDAEKNFNEVRADISKFSQITEGLDSRASSLEARMKDLGFVLLIHVLMRVCLVLPELVLVLGQNETGIQCRRDRLGLVPHHRSPSHCLTGSLLCCCRSLQLCLQRWRVQNSGP